MTHLLLLLRPYYPEPMRQRYYQTLRDAFPEIQVTLVDGPEAAAPWLPETDILMTFGPMIAPYDLLKNADRLKWIQAFTTGMDGVIDQKSLGADVILTSMKGIHGAPMSEAALMAMLALSRHLPSTMAQQQQKNWQRLTPSLLRGKTAGIFGIGTIAEALAPRLKAMEMRVVGISGGARDVPGFDEMRLRSDLVHAVADLDHFIILTPLTPETRHIVNAPVLKAMKKGSFLINIARGGVVEEFALLDALKNGPLAAAALDVFSTEPLPPDSPFWDLPNALITAHMGGTFDEYPEYSLPIVTQNIRSFLKGDFAAMINRVR